MEENCMKLGVFGYVAPPDFKGAKAFVDNIHKFKTKNELFLFSDYKHYGFHDCMSPEVMRHHNPRCGISNALFVSSIRYAVKRGFTHMLYIEADCRVGRDNWDQVMFDEYFSFKFPKVAAGSLVAHSCTNGGFDYYQKFWRFLMDHGEKRHVIPLYGIPVMAGVHVGEFKEDAGLIVKPGDARTKYKPSVYPNGALGIYDVAWMCELFGIKPDQSFKDGFSMVEHVQGSAWDHMIGVRLYDRFGANALDMVGHLDSVFSSYGDTITTEEQRINMLREGTCVAAHQFKSEVQP
jgi:hypothetical protein